MTKDEAYRDSIQFFGLTPKNGFKAGKLYSYKPITGTGDFTCTRSTTAYRTAQDGELELMAINTPRVDYANTCPQLLIEDSATNLVFRSQEFDNGYWGGSNRTVTANSTTAPDGSTTADTLADTAVTGTHFLASTIFTVTSGATYTISAYFKNFTRRYVLLYEGASDIGNFFDLQTGTALGSFGTGTKLRASIEALADGWYRCSVTYVQVGTIASAQVYLSNNGTSVSYLGNGSSIYVWGCQVELGGYATSYIPTTSVAVTRGADVIKNDTLDYTSTALSMFLRVRLDNTGSGTVRNLLYLVDSSNGSYVGLWADADNKITFTTYEQVSGDQNDYQTGDNGNEIVNIAFSIDLVAKTYAFVVDGVEISSGSITNDLPSTFDELYLGQYTGNYAEKDGIIGVMYFDTELTGAELQSLTV